MRAKISVMVVLFFAFATMSFAADCPKATGHMNDIARRLPEEMVKNLETFGTIYSKIHHLNLVILVMNPPDEGIFPVMTIKFYARQVIAFMDKDGQVENDRGTLLFIFYTDWRPPEVEANGELEPLLTFKLRRIFQDAVAGPIQDRILSQVIVQGVNSVSDAFLDLPHGH